MSIAQPVPREDWWSDETTVFASGTAADFRERLASVTAARLDAIENAAVALLHHTLSEPERERATSAAAALARFAGTLSSPHAVRLALEVEHLLRASSEMAPSHLHHLCELVLRLRDRLDHGPAGMDSRVPDEKQRSQRVLVVESDRKRAESLAIEALAQGLQAEVAYNLPAARGSLDRRRPDMVLLDLDLTDSLDAGRTLLAELAASIPPVPTVVMAGSTELRQRVAAAALGAKGFVPKSLPPSEILSVVTDCLDQVHVQKSTVLVVDDDPGTLETVQRMLEADGTEIVILQDPHRFWDVLERSTPDLILLDVEMPHFTGTELCQAIRNDPFWRNTPVLFMADDPSWTLNRGIARADEMLAKPLQALDLRERVTYHLERAQVQRRVAETDMLTGASSRRKATQNLSQLVRMAVRHHDPFSLALIRVDCFKEINADQGRIAGDAVLARLGQVLLDAFRDGDVVARWSGAEFVVGMMGMSSEAALERLAAVMEIFGQQVFQGASGPFSATCSLVLSQYPDDGHDVPMLYASADSVLQTIQAAGRGRMVQATGLPDDEVQDRLAPLDVLVVTSDEALGGVIVHALQTRGYSVGQVVSGADALTAVKGASRGAPRVILLDSTLDDRDGFELLHDLQQANHGNQPRVLLLTERSTERDVLRALQLGAFEHIAKPFSLPILLQRVHKALEG